MKNIEYRDKKKRDPDADQIVILEKTRRVECDQKNHDSDDDTEEFGQEMKNRILFDA